MRIPISCSAAQTPAYSRAQISCILYVMSFVLRLLKAHGMTNAFRYSKSYRFFFYSFDCHEPPHVHMRRECMA